MKKNGKMVTCPVCGQVKSVNETVPGELVRQPIADAIRKKYPDWTSDNIICITDLNRFRDEYIQDIIEHEKGDLSTLEQQVLTSLKKNQILSRNINKEFRQKLTFRERLSDKIADFAGSWTFIIGFIVILLAWITMNSIVLLKRPFDPYPFILLNLVLSSLAAFQAPVILMSQNRQESRDRLQSENDYKINLKAEFEIRNLHEKLDHLLKYQWQRLLEIQRIQTEMMQEIIQKK
ncbi:MAG: DUF1003 domain-containing protein [Spirochaetes bacterium]|nr:DUF1003 domain-containing protein [Spirochaetota bacterium]